MFDYVARQKVGGTSEVDPISRTLSSPGGNMTQDLYPRLITMAPVVEAYQAARGVSIGVAVTFVAEIGDLRRFDNPRQLMAFLLWRAGGDAPGR